MPGSRVRVPPLLLSKSSSSMGLDDFGFSVSGFGGVLVPTEVPNSPKSCESSAEAAQRKLLSRPALDQGAARHFAPESRDGDPA
jgi:hypothetical protein